MGDVNAAADSRTALAWNAVEKIAESDAGGWLMEFTARNLLRERVALVAEVERLGKERDAWIESCGKATAASGQLRAERDAAQEKVDMAKKRELNGEASLKAASETIDALRVEKQQALDRIAELEARLERDS